MTGLLDPPATRRPDTTTRLLAAAGIAGAVLALLLVGGLHLLDPSVNPVRRTLSQYALGDLKILFDAGVLALAAGSAALLAAGVRSGLVPARSVAAAGFAVWVAALVVLVVFVKVDWSVGPTTGGLVHRWAGIVAFLALPVAVLALARRWWGTPAGRVFAPLAALTAAAALAWLSPFVLGAVLAPVTGTPWWRFVPIGLVQRGLAGTEVLAVLVVAAWVLSRRGRP